MRSTRDPLLTQASPLCSPAIARFVHLLSLYSLMLSYPPSIFSKFIAEYLVVVVVVIVITSTYYLQIELLSMDGIYYSWMVSLLVVKIRQ